jgi:hypothetical protein
MVAAGGYLGCVPFYGALRVEYAKYTGKETAKPCSPLFVNLLNLEHRSFQFIQRYVVSLIVEYVGELLVCEDCHL